MGKKKPTTEPLSFEQSLAELEAIVHQLESGKLGLEESLQQYELGVTHLKCCYKLLREAERRVELVCQVDSAGNARTEAFDCDMEASLTEKAAGRSRSRGSKASSRSEVDDASSLF